MGQSTHVGRDRGTSESHVSRWARRDAFFALCSRNEPERVKCGLGVPAEAWLGTAQRQLSDVRARFGCAADTE